MQQRAMALLHEETALQGSGANHGTVARADQVASDISGRHSMVLWNQRAFQTQSQRYGHCRPTHGQPVGARRFAGKEHVS